MKSIKSDKPCEPKAKFPCLMIAYNGEIVLFTSSSTGTCVHSDSTHQGMGRHLNRWSMGNFKPYNGSVCLEN
jgi:hypothetical protein